MAAELEKGRERADPEPGLSVVGRIVDSEVAIFLGLGLSIGERISCGVGLIHVTIC